VLSRAQEHTLGVQVSRGGALTYQGPRRPPTHRREPVAAMRWRQG
jgi:hypothetical protein